MKMLKNFKAANGKLPKYTAAQRLHDEGEIIAQRYPGPITKKLLCRKRICTKRGCICKITY